MDDPVEYGISNGWLADAVMPFRDRVLTGNEGRFKAVPILHKLQKVSAVVLGQWLHCPVIDGDEIEF